MAGPGAEIDVTTELVRELLRAQHPDLAELPLVEVASGWDNVVYRLGADLAVRLPRRALAAVLVAGEQRWLTELAPRLPLPIPAPVRTGGPGAGYPWSWSVVPWFPGEEAAVTDPEDWPTAAERLGEFLAALHQPAAVDAPLNPYRGVPLADRSERLIEGLEQLEGRANRTLIEARWADLVSTPEWTGPKVWLHGDLHPRNLVVHEGRLSAVIDFGDLTAGDPAVDLSVAWIWLPTSVRPTFRAAAGGVDDDTWRRAKGWALALGVALSNGDDRVARLGERAVAAALADPG